MKRYFIPILIAILVLTPGFLMGCVKEKTPTTALPTLPAGWKSYYNSQHDYSVGYPDNWNKEEYSSLGMVSFYEPKIGVGFDIGVGKTRETDLERYVETNKIPPSEGATYLIQRPIVVNGRQGYELVLTLPSEFFGTGFREGLMKHRQVVFLAKGRGYVLTCTALEDEWNQYTNIFDTAINSFVIR
ncbi:MAG: hypothetical protein MUO97_03540 [Dehalococcoidia bacterium]|nr:hypothetical protein [Dehalococcoidia bacterium]